LGPQKKKVQHPGGQSKKDQKEKVGDKVEPLSTWEEAEGGVFKVRGPRKNWEDLPKERDGFPWLRPILGLNHNLTLGSKAKSPGKTVLWWPGP